MTERRFNSVVRFAHKRKVLAVGGSAIAATAVLFYIRPEFLEPRSDIISVESDDFEILNAMRKARETFPEFVQAVEADWNRAIPVLESAMVKAYFADSHGGENGEHMWVQFEGYEAGRIRGTLISRPAHVDSVTEGDRVSFPLPNLSDWLYVEDGVARGAYTVKILRMRMSEAEREEHDRSYPFLFED